MSVQEPGAARASVLCVEDVAETRTLLVRLLSRRFAQVLEAADGEEGLALFRRHRPGLVIADIQMPGLDGIAMARAIRAEAPATRIIISTAHGESANLLSAIEVGVSDYVVKPFTPERLLAAVDKCIQVDTLERALHASNQKIETLLNSIMDALFALDTEGRFTYLNPQAAAYFRRDEAQLMGRRFQDLYPHATAVHQAFEEASRTQATVTFEHFTPGAGLWHEVKVFPMDGGISVHLRDITLRKATEEEIRFLAYYDKLTGLANRTLLQDRLQRAIQRSVRLGQGGAVLFLDLDRFKYINDSLGHEVGDMVLKEIAERLKACIRTTDTAARLGGDEFILLLDGFQHPDNIHSISHRILFSVAQEIPYGDLRLSVTASIGICFFPKDGTSVDDLLRAADSAMYHGKSKGKNTYQFYHPDMNTRAQRYLQLEQELRKTVQSRDFVLHYQPQHELGTGKLVGFEALVRWQHAELGLVSPAEFIPLAEETGLILKLGDWVLETACRQAREWRDMWGQPFLMAVNLSGRQFWEGDIVASVAQGLASSGLPPEGLELEITESLVMRDVELAIEKMRHLTALGVRLSIDDFGTGYSSLAALKRFPIHTLKVDRTFVQDVTTNPNDAAICASILALARTMNLSVVAEGIETQAQLDFFLAQGCQVGQGYLFARPLPADAAARCFGARGPWPGPSTGHAPEAQARP